MQIEKCQKKQEENIGHHLKKKKKEHQQCSNVYVLNLYDHKEITALGQFLQRTYFFYIFFFIADSFFFQFAFFLGPYSEHNFF